MNKYTANDTMKLIGRQNLEEIDNIEPNVGDAIRDIISANGIPEQYANNMFGMCADAMFFGTILGKRIERLKRKGGAV